MTAVQDSSENYALAHHTQRLNALEDLLRRNEGSLSHVLNRLKDVELALNSVHKVTNKYQPEMSLVLDEITGVKRRLDNVDHTWRSKAIELDTALQNEVKNGKQTPLTSDPLFLRTISEVQVLRQETQDIKLDMKRGQDSAAADAKSLRQVESDTKWLTENLREHVSHQQEFVNSQQRKNEQLLNVIADGDRQRETGLAQLRSMLDGVVKALRDEIALRFENEARSRVSLQSDVVTAFGKMRDDVIKGFSQTATNLRNLDETSHSLETVLRAEVRSRMSALEEQTTRLDTVEDRMKKEAKAATEYLKNIDSQMSEALREVKDVTLAETRSQLDRVWRSLNEVHSKVEDQSHQVEATTANNMELQERRKKLQLDGEFASMKEDVLTTVERRMATAIVPKERIATRTDLEDAKTVMQLKVDEVLLEMRKQQGRDESVSQSKFDTKLAAMEGQILQSERDVKAVAESLHTSQMELTDKMLKMERQAQAMDALQRNLQESWERDQQQMESYLQGIRDQVMLMAEDQQGNMNKLNAANGEGAEQSATGESGSPESSPSKANQFVYKMLDDDLKAVKASQREFENSTMRQLAEMRADCGANGSQNSALQERFTAEINTLKQKVEQLTLAVPTTLEKASLQQMERDVADIRSRTLTLEHQVLKGTESEGTSSPSFDSNAVKELATLQTRCNELDKSIQKVDDEMVKLKDVMNHEVLPSMKESLETFVKDALEAALAEGSRQPTRGKTNEGTSLGNTTSGEPESPPGPPSTEQKEPAATESTAPSNPPPNTIWFFSSVEGPYAAFANFYVAPFDFKGRKWPTSEHAFQAAKFEGSDKDVDDVYNAATAKEAAAIGRDRNRPKRDGWRDMKDGVMMEIVKEKFSQHADLKKLLLDTGDQTIVEHTTHDTYWGDGGDGSGENKMGKCLMDVRQILQNPPPVAEESPKSPPPPPPTEASSS